MLVKLREDVFRELGFDSQMSRWDFRVSDIQASIGRVSKRTDRDFFQARLDEILHISRAPPVTRTPSFNQFRELAQALASRIPEYFEKNLEAQGFAKKKFKNEEEESKFMQSIREKVEEDAVTRLTEELSIRDDESTMTKVVHQKEDRFEQGREFIDKLSRIKGPKDVELEGKRILARFSLQVKMDKCNLSINRARTESPQSRRGGSSSGQERRQEETCHGSEQRPQRPQEERQRRQERGGRRPAEGGPQSAHLSGAHRREVSGGVHQVCETPAAQDAEDAAAAGQSRAGRRAGPGRRRGVAQVPRRQAQPVARDEAGVREALRDTGLGGQARERVLP